MHLSEPPTKTVNSSEFRERFEELLQEVINDSLELTIEEGGQPVAVLSPANVDERHEEQRSFDEWLELIQQRANLSGEEADELAKEAVEAVRARTD